MPPAAFALVAVSAVLHVVWNVLLKSSGDPLRAATTGMVAASVVAIPVAAVGWVLIGRPPIPSDAIILGTVSGLLEGIYFVLLSAAYRRGDLSVVYPTARGTAPLLAVLIGVLVLGETLPPLGWAGVGLLLAGILALQRPWRVLRASSRVGLAESAVPFAIATGVTIAAYSSVDSVGARLIEPWVYATVLTTVAAVALVAWVMVGERRTRIVAVAAGLGSVGLALGPSASGESDQPAFVPSRAIVGGLLTLIAYICVLGAFAIAPLAAVAPLRESAIVLASAWGILRLREAADPRDAALRLGAAVVVLIGAGLLAIAG
ncbi:MAG: EamA family transporter [Chloroflexota bacterium]